MDGICLVTRAYRSAHPHPLHVHEGEQLNIDPERTSEWPGWIWGTSPDGCSGWVPESCIDRKSDGIHARYDYDATELNAEQGETLSVLLEENGWVRCRNRTGVEGWLPKEYTSLL